MTALCLVYHHSLVTRSGEVIGAYLGDDLLWFDTDRLAPEVAAFSAAAVAHLDANGKTDLPENDAMPSITVDPDTFAVRIDGDWEGWLDFFLDGGILLYDAAIGIVACRVGAGVVVRTGCLSGIFLRRRKVLIRGGIR